MNSGISPNRSKSSGSTSRRMAPVRRSSGPRTSDPNPIPDPLPRAPPMIFSSPANAPPQNEQDIGRIHLQELLLRNACAPPCGGTEATVPSMIFSSACCNTLAPTHPA